MKLYEEKNTPRPFNTNNFLLGLLTIAFVVLKLCNVITWSWWWVTLPIWGWFALLIIFLFTYIIGTFIHECYKEFFK